MEYTKYKVEDTRVLDGHRVLHIGMDSSGRPILLSPRMWGAWLETMEGLGFANEIDIVQGAYMKFLGGGADSSAGYHDLSGCLDTRTWDIDSQEERRVIHVARSVGWAVWRRDQTHGGFDEHMHWVLLGETDVAAGAKWQMRDYREGGDGLVDGESHDDYHWRPNPIPTFNFAKWKKEKDLPTVNDFLSAKLNPDDGNESETVRTALNKGADANANIIQLANVFNKFRENAAKRDKALAAAIKEIADSTADPATKQQLENVAESLAAKLDTIDNQVS